MPLEKSSSSKAFNTNVKTLMNDVGKSPHVKSKAQALAIAYETQREAKGHAYGGVASQAFQSTMPGSGLGVVPGFAHGGTPTFKGPIVSSVPGRTDNHFTHVPSGAFVIPADIVSGHGEGNTLAGMETLQKLFRMGKHTGKTMFGGSSIHKLAQGGAPSDEHVGKPVPVKLAGGEIVVPPENVHETMCRITGKKLTLDQAHSAMDQWVLNNRKKLRKTLAKLPGPARD